MCPLLNENKLLYDEGTVIGLDTESSFVGYFIVAELNPGQSMDLLEDWMRACKIDIYSSNQVESIFMDILKYMQLHHFDDPRSYFSLNNCRTISLIKSTKSIDSPICNTQVLKTFYPKVNQKTLQLLKSSNQTESD